MTGFACEEIARHRCLDCGVNVIEAGDYCMLSAKIWRDTFSLGWDDNLCIACIEARLGRKLSLGLYDFVSLPSVEGFPPSDTLMDRLGFSKTMRAGMSSAGRRPTAAARRRTPIVAAESSAVRQPAATRRPSTMPAAAIGRATTSR